MVEESDLRHVTRRHHAPVIVTLLAVLMSSAQAQGIDPHVRASMTSLGAPTESSLAVRITIQVDPGWHIGAQHTGTGGLPTTLSWSVPEGWTVSHVQWATPLSHRTRNDTLFIYQGRLHIDVLLARSSSRPGDPIRVTIAFGACREDLCVPGEIALNLRP